MITFPKRVLGELCRVQSGYAFKSKDWQEDGVPVVQIANVKPRYLDMQSTKFVSGAVAAQAQKFGLKHGDILISMTGHIGSVARKSGDSQVMLNQRVGRFEDIDASLVDEDYLYEVLQSSMLRERFQKLGYGAAQPNISPKLIGSVEVPLPPLDTQRRIAAILGAYDDLIEVNRRRVAVLEEMARGLFEEWFVRFRFPGHESMPIVDTPDGPLPEGWAHAPLEDFLVLQRGFDLPKSKRVEGSVPVFSASGYHGGHNEAKVVGPGIVTGRSGTIGKVHLVMDDYWPLNTALYVREFRAAGPAYALLMLRSLDLAKHSSGSAVPTLNRNHVHGIKLPAAPQPLMDQFERIAFTKFECIQTIGQQNEGLTVSRDLLLPRLISGQLSVEAAERGLELAA